MKKIECTRNLFDDLARLSLSEVNSFLNSVQQLATVNFLKHKIELLFVLEEFNQLYDVRVTLAMMERLDFLKHPGTSVSRDLINDLHGVLEVRVEGCTSLDRGVSALPKNFSGQFVQFCNSSICSFLLTH